MNDLQLSKPSDMTPAQRDALLNDLEDYADEIGGGHHPFLKCKQGWWLAGSDEVPVQNGSVVCMDLWNLVEGWQKWKNGTLQDSQLGCRTRGFKSPQRGALDAQDEMQWEKGEDGNPMDPWTKVMNVLFMFAEGHSPIDTNAMIFGTSSAGGRGSVGDIYRTYVQHIRQYPDEMPVVKIGSTTFKFKTKSGREVTPHKPTFELLGWTDEARWNKGNDYSKLGAKRDPMQRATQLAKEAEMRETHPPLTAPQHGTNHPQAPIDATGDPLDHVGPVDDAFGLPPLEDDPRVDGGSNSKF